MIEIQLPRSKSLVIRYLILNYLYYDQVFDIQEDDAEDVKIVHQALLDVQHRSIDNTEPTVIDIKDCGAGYRFLMAMLSVVNGKWVLTGTERLLIRPIDPLLYALRRIGAQIEETDTGWLIEGNSSLRAGSVVIDCTQSSQFASALWLIAQKLGNPAIQTTPLHFASEGYLELTKQVWGNFFMDGVPQKIETDWSAAVYWYAYALLHPGKKLLLKGLEYPSIQQDSEMGQWFSEWGVQTTAHSEGIVIVSPVRLEILDQEIDFQNNLDLAPVMASLATIYPFQLTLHGIANLDYKESQRGTHLIDTLGRFTAIQTDKSPDTDKISSIKISKRTNPLPDFISFDSHHDHRFVMAFHLFSDFSQIEISNKEVVSKSYPNFFASIPYN